MILSIDEVNDILDRVYEEFPEELFQELNGGVLLLEEAMPDPELGENVYMMGEYCVDEMGRYINIHELTHHVEGLAGERSLEYKDSAQLDAMRRGEDWPPEET